MDRFPDNLIAFQRMFPDAAACAAWLASVRWPDAFECPGCGHDRCWALRGKAHTFECTKCHRQTSVTAGTILHGSKLDLTIWFWAAYLMATHSNGMSALQLQKQLGLGSYRSAWMLAAKLRRAMVDPDHNPLSGLVEIDETSLPFRTKEDPPASGAGRSHEGKMLVVGSIKVGDGNTPGRLCLNSIAHYGADKPQPVHRAKRRFDQYRQDRRLVWICKCSPRHPRPSRHWQHGCPRRAALDPSDVLQPQGLGPRRLSRTAPQILTNLPRRIRLPLQSTQNPPSRLQIPVRNRSPNKTGQLQHVDPTGRSCISGLWNMKMKGTTFL